METVTDFIFLGSQITVDDDCRHEIKRCLLLGRKAMTKPRQQIKKVEICIVKALVFPVVMYNVRAGP